MFFWPANSSVQNRQVVIGTHTRQLLNATNFASPRYTYMCKHMYGQKYWFPERKKYVKRIQSQRNIFELLETFPDLDQILQSQNWSQFSPQTILDKILC